MHVFTHAIAYDKRHPEPCHARLSHHFILLSEGHGTPEPLVIFRLRAVDREKVPGFLGGLACAYICSRPILRLTRYPVKDWNSILYVIYSVEVIIHGFESKKEEKETAAIRRARIGNAGLS
jgi:hypothetical protein